MPEIPPRGVLTSLNSVREFVFYALQGLVPNDEYCILAPAPLFLTKSCPQLQDKTGAIRLSAESVYKHARKHKEATPDIYAQICPCAIIDGEWIMRKDNSSHDGRISVFVEHEAKLWRFGIKIASVSEIYLTTLFHCEPRHLKREQNRGIMLRI